MAKKFINAIYLSVMTKNLNWEISTKNLVTFKSWNGVNDKKFQDCGISLKNLFFLKGGGGGCMKKKFF